MASVGQELLDVPLPDMVSKLAMGIATAQSALDEVSVDTAITLADTTVPVVMNVTKVIAADGSVSFQQSAPIQASLLQLGLLPTFYQFSEATIEVGMDIKTTSSETNVKVSAKATRKIIEADGSIRYEQDDPIKVSLLDLGVSPSFFAFSEATAEVVMDLSVKEETTESGDRTTRTLFGTTRNLKTERRLNRDVSVHSKVTTKIVTVPGPALAEPSRSVVNNSDGGEA